jgi:hypothetical protein
MESEWRRRASVQWRMGRRSVLGFCASSERRLAPHAGSTSTGDGAVARLDLVLVLVEID